MLKPEEMAKIKVICAKSHLKKVIEELHKSKAVDIIDHSKDDNIDIGIPFEESAKLSETTISARTLISQLGLETDEKIEPIELDSEKLKDAVNSIRRLHNDVAKLKSIEKETADRLKLLEESRENVESIQKLGISAEYYAESKTLSYFIGHIENLKTFSADMKAELGSNYDFTSIEDNNKALVSVFVGKEKEMQALKVLQQHNFSEMKISGEFIGKNAGDIKNIEKEIRDLLKKEQETAEQLKTLKEKWAKRLPEIERALTIVIRKAEAPLKFGETKNISIITGWVPEKNKEALTARLNEITEQMIFIENLKIDEHDTVPIKLNNPKLVSPYEFLLRLYSMPSYHEVDPALFMYFTFPLFFGFMLGDIGYGLVLLAGVLIIKKMKPAWSQFMGIMAYSAISSVIFGFLYGEFFGLEKIGGYHFWHIISRVEGINEMLIVSLIIGALHVNFGLVLGFINEMHHGFKRAMLEKGSWFILEIAIVLLALSYLGKIILTPLVGWVVFVIAVIMLYFGEGVKGIIEIPTILSHTLSYARLMAVGLASVGLAVVINEQSAPLFSQGIFGIIAAILIIVLGHGLNLALGIIGPFLHSLRLHYVEHFTKYYKGGGKEFRAFGAEDD